MNERPPCPETRFERPNTLFRRIEEADRGLIKTWRNEQMAVLRQVRPLTDEDQVAWLSKIQSDTRQSLFAILDLSEELVGYCGLTNIDWVNRRGEVSFLVYSGCDRERYRLVFLESLSVLKEHGFCQLQLHKIFTETFAFRAFHIQVLEELGFELTGKLVDHIYHEGGYMDSLIHSVLNKN